MTVSVQTADFDISAEIACLTGANSDIGAVASFTGKVRGGTGADALASMTLEHYPGMTDGALAAIEAEAVARFNLAASRIVHRTGELYPGDNIVLVIACARHRGDAFAAAEFLMDYLKTKAPFWKKETLRDGSTRWVAAAVSDDAAAARW